MAKNLLNENELLNALMRGGGGDHRTGPTAPATTGKKAKPPLPERMNKTQPPEQGLGTSGVRTAAAAGPYYSMPQLGTQADYDLLMNAITSAEQAAKDKMPAYNKARTNLEQIEEGLALWTEHLNAIREAYGAAPSAQGEDLIGKATAQMETLMAEYLTAQAGFDQASTEFDPLYKAYEQAVGNFNSYAARQQKLYDDWRGTIRDAGTIESELAEVDRQMRSLTAKDRAVDPGSGAYLRGDGGIAGMPYGAAQSETEVQEASPERGALEARKELLQEELDWSRYFQYHDLLGKDDFEDKSMYAPGDSGDPRYNYINKEAQTVFRQALADQNSGAQLVGTDNSHLQLMKDEEVGIYNYLYATQGKDAANEYIRYLEPQLTSRQRGEIEGVLSQAAQAHPIISSALSVGMAPLKGMSYLGQAMELLTRGQIDQNAGYNRFSYMPTAIRNQVGQMAEEKWGPVGSFAYQTAMSMGDFLLNAGISGGSQGLSLAIMGSGAAADSTIAAKDRGLDDAQAFALGTIAGLAEILTEKFSLEKLLDADLLADGAKKYILTNMATEGSEEVASSVMNLMADIMISRDQSEWRQSVDAYMEQGLSESEATGKAVGDQLLSLALDALGGAISGGIMAGGNAAIQGRRTERVGEFLGDQGLSDEDIQMFIETGLESEPETPAHKIATELQEKVQKGKTLTNNDLSRLYQANVQAVAAEQEGKESEGLSLPTVEQEADSAEAGVTENGKDVSENGRNVTAAGQNVSIAEQIRQRNGINVSENVNGGTNNGNVQNRTEGPAPAQTGAGDDTLYGGGQRYDGAGTGGKAGSLADSAERAARADRSRATVARQNLARSLRLEKVSSLDLGLQSGTETKNIQVMPKEHWDEEMSRVADRIYNETGKEVTYVMGRIQIRTAGGVGYARGVITGDRILVQADHYQVGMEQIADHEAYHAKIDFAGKDLNEEIRQHIIDTFSKEEFQAVLDQYIVALRGVIDVNEAKTGAEFEAAVRQIEEELFADAYAGINAFGAHADRFTEAVNKHMEQLHLGKQTQQENGTEQPTGPPQEKYSYAGESAANADLDALAKAKEMRGAGVADETIRQQTGWFVGMDGKWRWEIDDSGMQYYRAGDALFSEMHPEYARHQELMKKWLYGELSQEEEAEFRGLDDTWGRESQRLSDRVRRGNATLQNVLRHDALFEAYPQLRGTRVIFKDLPDGIRGQYDPESNTITLRESMRSAPENTLFHEIQHAIQNAEGFTQGASTEYWDSQLVTKPEYAREVQQAENDVRRMETAFHKEWADDINLNLAKQYIELDNRLWNDELDPVEQQEIADKMEDIEQLAEENGWGDLFNDYYYAVGQLQMAKERARLHRRTSADLYRNTAGEIEARDAAERRKLTPEQRREMAPAAGDERTVFADGARSLSEVLKELDLDYAQLQQPYVDTEFTADELQGNIQTVAQMEPVAEIAGTEFAKGEVDLITQVERFFDGLGNEVRNDRLGDVILDRRGVKSDIAHGIGRKKAAAFAAVPDVIRNGQVVDYQENWKGRGYDTAVVAAPVRIGGQEHFAGVIMVRSRRSNRFYLHEVLTTENGALPFKTGALKQGDSGGDAPSIFSILDKIRGVKNQQQTGERFSLEDTDSHGRNLSDEQKEYFAKSQARDDYGRLLVLYHQTAAEFTIFDTRHSGAGSTDGQTPFGIFLKRSAADIGLSGKKQMALYANIANPLRTTNREDLDRQLRDLSPRYSDLSNRHKALDAEYHERFEQAKKAWRDYVTDWRAANPGANRRALNDDPRFNELFDAEDAVVEEWTAAADRLSVQAKEAITEALKRAGYDGVFLENDAGSWGRRTDAIIALDPEQVKSITNRAPTTNPDIRYSMDDSAGQAEDESAAKVPSQQELNREREAWLQEEYNQKQKRQESRPLIAKRDLRNTMLNLFSVPSGQRAELGGVIDSYADRLIKNGQLTEEDRKAFFDRMYASGVMTMPADEYHAMARSHIAEGRIYVSDSVKSDFGDDWADIRKRAFAAGVYLVNDRNAAGIDQWNATLSEEDMLPGLFDSEETDQRSILERIVQVAEEGKDEHLSLPEYTRRLSQQEGISEDDFLDNMERQLDWALRTFAEKAQLEVSLRDRTGVKIAQERQRGNERMARQKATEAQRRADERQARKDMAKRQRDRKELRELQQKTLKQLQWLSKNQYRAPEELKDAWNEVLGDIDLYAVSAADEMHWSEKHQATWKDLAQMYKDAQKHDPNFLPSKELERIVARLDGEKIADMDLGALQDLYKAAIGLRTEFYNRNNVINDEMQRLFAEVYTDAKKEIEAAPGGYTGKTVDKLLNLDQLTPMNVLQRMGGWDPNGAFYSMAKQLERGERDIRAYTVKANRMLQEFLEEHEDWVKKADGQGKDAIWYELEVPQLLELGMGDKPIFGDTVKVFMTPAQKVHMYLESKNLDNLRHMTGGRTFANKELYSQGKRQEALSQGTTIRLAPETVKKLVSDLTAEEMELAKVLDQYYNSFATKEINKISNTLYGYDKAMGKNYAPIYTNKNYTKSEFGVFDTTAEGVGNLKGRQYAVNPSYNISAFDAFERHVDQTARFCGMAIPARNWTTLMNWREKNNSTGDVITHKWGEESKKYITDLITTLQAGDEVKSDTISSGISKLQSNYITAIFGANPGIVLKQLGSIPMASAYLDARNVPSLRQIKSIDRELISKYTQDLEWRTMGYSMPETRHLKDNPNWTQSNKAYGFLFGGDAITAMDGWAASTLWPWAENKVHREYPELEVGTQAQVEAGESPFYRKVAEEFENAVARSQSTSDEIHQSRLRKSKNPLAKAFTMFRSDSAQTYNTIRQKIGEAQYLVRSKTNGTEIKAAKKAAGAAFMAMVLNAAWAEAVSFLMALWKNKGKYYRDDEDELTAASVIGEMVSNMLGSFAGTVTLGEELYELAGNILAGNKLYDIETPGMEQLNDAISVISESGSGMREVISGASDIVKNGGDLGKYLAQNSGEILGHIKDLAETAATYLPGVPVSNLEAYILGAFKWISPELATAYEDLFSSAGKSDLAGMTGDALAGRIEGILDNRGVAASEETASVLASLYEAGYKIAVPSDVPSSITIDSEKWELGPYQQQTYGNIWSSVVQESLEEIVGSGIFTGLPQEEQAKTLSRLYDYAAERAKDALFDDFELGSVAVKIGLAAEYGVNADVYFLLQGTLPQFDADGNDSYKAAEIQAGIDAFPEDLTTEQKAALWQLLTTTTSAKNNPYSREIGQKVLDAKNAQRDDEEELQGLTLGSW